MFMSNALLRLVILMSFYVVLIVNESMTEKNPT